MKALPALVLACVLSTALTSLTGCSKQSVDVDISAAVQKLASTETDVKVQACTDLAKAGAAAVSAIPALTPLLKDPDALVRRLAAYALGQIGPKATSALPALREALNDADPDVASDALIALRSIGDTNANVAMPNVMSGPGGTQ